MWSHTGTQRPPFAQIPASGQESVWDYPRPPCITRDARRVTVHAGTVKVADTQRAVRVLETASPPTFYLPPEDVRMALLERASGDSFCEWKGQAGYWNVLLPDGTRLASAGWSYERPTPAFAGIAGWVSFYPARLRCEVGGEVVRPQGGGFYGGWVTDEIVGPYKGEPGTGDW